MTFVVTSNLSFVHSDKRSKARPTQNNSPKEEHVFVATPCKQRDCTITGSEGNHASLSNFTICPILSSARRINYVCYWLLIRSIIFENVLTLCHAWDALQRLCWGNLGTGSSGRAVTENVIDADNIWKWCHGSALRLWWRNNISDHSKLIQGEEKKASWNTSSSFSLSLSIQKPSTKFCIIYSCLI